MIGVCGEWESGREETRSARFDCSTGHGGRTFSAHLD